MAQTTNMPESAESPQSVAGLLAEFADSKALLAAAARVREAGYRRWDCHSPFPVHGIDRAMGMRSTPLPWLVLGGGIVGAAAALLLQWWTNAVDYPFIASGKPYFSLPANIPITFELIVLFSALAAFVGALALIRLPELAHPLLASPRFRRVTTGGLFISIEATDPKFDEVATREFLRSLGATAVEVCCRPATGRSLPSWVPWLLAMALALSVVPPLLIARARCVKSELPRIHIIQDMDFQPKYRAQAASPLFADGRAMRPPMPGTIADGQLDQNEHLYLGKQYGRWAAGFPLPVSESLILRGQERFNVYCAPCHGLAGMGDGIVSQRAIQRRDPGWVPPLSLHASSVREQPAGQLFSTISYGIRKMPSYGSQIPVEDRWAIVLYLRALQRSQNATLDDVPEQFRSQLR